MDIKDAIQLTNKIFIYKSDTSYYLLPETWRVIGADGKGDCEDHQLTAIWYYSDGNWFKWIWNVHFGPFRLWLCKSPSGEGHLVTEVKSGVYKGMFFDNISKKLITRTQLDDAGYKLIMRHYFPLTAIKILVGYTLGSVGRIIRRILD